MLDAQKLALNLSPANAITHVKVRLGCGMVAEIGQVRENGAPSTGRPGSYHGSLKRAAHSGAINSGAINVER